MPLCRAVLERWMGPREDWGAEFDSIDMTNKKGEGNVLFTVRPSPSLESHHQEFFNWALNKNMDFQGNMGVNE